MKSSLKFILTIIILCSINVYSQQMEKDSFIFNGKKMEYCFSSTSKEATITDFYVIISETKTNAIDFFKDQNICFETNADFYLLNINEDLTLSKKQKLLFEFIQNIISKRKLTGSKFHLIANSNFDDYYENNYYKKENLSEFRIASVAIFKDPIYSICQFTSKR